MQGKYACGKGVKPGNVYANGAAGPEGAPDGAIALWNSPNIALRKLEGSSPIAGNDGYGAAGVVSTGVTVSIGVAVSTGVAGIGDCDLVGERGDGDASICIDTGDPRDSDSGSFCDPIGSSISPSSVSLSDTIAGDVALDSDRCR